MDQSPPTTPRSRSALPWLLTALVVIIAAGGFYG